jgi:uncharacterized OB-fold protein
LLPDLEDDNSRGFWDGCARHELLVQRCVDCALVTHPPRPMCPRCRSTSREWIATEGRGRVWSYVIAHPPLLQAYAELAPYNVIVVELDDHPGFGPGIRPRIRMVGNLVVDSGAEINSVDGHTIQIGEPVEVTFTTIDDVTLPRWIRSTPRSVK